MSILARIGCSAIVVFALLGLAGCGGGQDASPDSARTTPSDAATPPASRTTTPGTPPAHRTLDEPEVSGLSLGELRRMAPTSQVEIALGNAHLQAGAIDSAIAHYRRSTELSPADPATWNYLGIALSRAGLYDEAEEAFHGAIRADGFYLETFINYGNLEFRRESWEGAVRQYEMATRIDSTVPTAWLNLAMAYERVPDEDQAILAYYKAIRYDDQNPDPWERLGNLYYRQKLFEGAVERWNQAYRRDPTRDDLLERATTIQAWLDSVKTVQ